jgi:hypothetical protein
MDSDTIKIVIEYLTAHPCLSEINSRHITSWQVKYEYRRCSQSPFIQGYYNQFISNSLHICMVIDEFSSTFVPSHINNIPYKKIRSFHR